MAEIDRVREEIDVILKKWLSLELAYNDIIPQILSVKGICIEADNQGLPGGIVNPCCFKLAKGFLQAGFKRVMEVKND